MLLEKWHYLKMVIVCVRRQKMLDIYYTISRAVIRFIFTGSRDRSPGSGRHRVTSARVEKLIVQAMSLRNRFALSVVNNELQRVRGES